MKAIVIDDSRAMRGILKRALAGMGFESEEAKDGQEALTRLAEISRPDVALVDWNMPNLNGYEFVKAVRQNPEFDEMKIVMVTTEVEMQNIANALTAGANEYVMKPFTEDVIREKLEVLGLVRTAA